MITNDELRAALERYDASSNPYERNTLLNSFPNLLRDSELLASRASAAGVSEAKVDDALILAKDEGADFVLKAVADLLGVKNWHQQDGSETWNGDVFATARKIVEAALGEDFEAALPLSPAAQGKAEPVDTVQVKPLKWLSDANPYFAATPFCRYRITRVEDDTGPHWETTIAYLGSTYQRHDTITEAKTAAQADYEARIRSALAHPSPTSISAGRDEGWQPIATAPKDGSAILTQHQDDLFPVAAFWSGDKGNWRRQIEGPEDVHIEGKWEYIYRDPTHWMPLRPLRSAKGSRE